jgi:hypothetical protein
MSYVVLKSSLHYVNECFCWVRPNVRLLQAVKSKLAGSPKVFNVLVEFCNYSISILNFLNKPVKLVPRRLSMLVVPIGQVLAATAIKAPSARAQFAVAYWLLLDFYVVRITHLFIVPANGDGRSYLLLLGHHYSFFILQAAALP